MAAEAMGIIFCSMEAIIAIVHAITEAVRTVRRNRDECEDIAKCVASVSSVLHPMYRSTLAVAMDPAMRGALDDLKVSLSRALDLLSDCQERRKVPRFLRSGDMARELRRVKEDIMGKVTLGIFAANVQTNITLKNMQCADPPPPRPVPHVVPQLMPWQRATPSQVARSMADFCCPNNWPR